MHHKYAKQGLAVITVSTDEIEEGKSAEVKEQVLKVLREKGATFTNVILDETNEFIQDKLRFIAAPCVYVFNREGKWTQFKSDDAEVKHEVIEKVVVDWLKEK